MRILVGIFSLVAIASTASATDLNCSVASPLEINGITVTQFTIDNVEGDESTLKADLPDQNTMEGFAPNNDGTIIASFSNECDNGYGVSLNVLDLQLLSSGFGSEVKGSLLYEESEQKAVSSQIICVKK